jgi:hypothetical protein
MTKELKNKEISIGWDVGGWSGKNHGFCVLQYENGNLKLLKAAKLNVYEVKENIEAVINEYKKNHTITIGIDAPLQFPVLFREIINNSPINIFNNIQNHQSKNPIAWRATDLFIKEHFKKTPLSATFSFLTSNATVAISLLGELKAKHPEFSILPFDNTSSLRAIEVYPGLLKSEIIKGDKVLRKYREITESSIFKNIIGFDYYFGEAKEKSDIADAVICALYGLGYSNLVVNIPKMIKEVPPAFITQAESEGWIFYPDLD